MGKNIVAQYHLLRRVLNNGRHRGPCFRSYSLCSRSEALVFSESSSSSLPKFSSNFSISNSSDSHFTNLSFRHCRPLCSASGSSSIIMIKSEDQFNMSLNKAQDKSLPAIFYFTAVWCGPCRLISPVIEELSKNQPQVTIYKIDIDQEGLENTLRQLNITSVPTLQFYHEGKKAAEIIGADVTGIKNTVEKLYK